jgi:hypothetical protein
MVSKRKDISLAPQGRQKKLYNLNHMVSKKKKEKYPRHHMVGQKGLDVS